MCSLQDKYLHFRLLPRSPVIHYEAKTSEISISQTSRLRDAMSMMDSSAIQIALVVDSHNRLIATLTDGDIRRALLRERLGIRGLSFYE